jgi:hypothetical protein
MRVAVSCEQKGQKRRKQLTVLILAKTGKEDASWWVACRKSRVMKVRKSELIDRWLKWLWMMWEGVKAW